MLETVEKSLHHSCRSELTRQGISLPLDRQSYSRRLLELNINAIAYQHNFTAPGRCQPLYILLINLQRLVFLINSRFSLFSVKPYVLFRKVHSLSQSYRANLPSSFNIIILNALIFSIYLPVSV